MHIVTECHQAHPSWPSWKIDWAGSPMGVRWESPRTASFVPLADQLVDRSRRGTSRDLPGSAKCIRGKMGKDVTPLGRYWSSLKLQERFVPLRLIIRESPPGHEKKDLSLSLDKYVKVTRSEKCQVRETARYWRYLCTQLDGMLHCP